MNLKEKLEGEDYVVLRQVLLEEKESWFSDDIEYKPCGTKTLIVPFVNLEMDVFVEDKKRYESAKKQFEEAEMANRKRKRKRLLIRPYPQLVALKVCGKSAGQLTLQSTAIDRSD